MKKLLSLILVMAMVLSLCACGKADDYEAAITLMEAGNYEEAIAAFTELGDYEDSAQKLVDCENALSYVKAVALFDAEQYEEALAMFTALGNYQDSKEKKLECENALAYQNALDLIASGDYENAYATLVALGDYKDVPQILTHFKEVEITTENWADYFVVVEEPEYIKNDFNENIEIFFRYYLRMNADCERRIFRPNESTVIFEFAFTPVAKEVQFSKTSDEYELLPPNPIFPENAQEEKCTFTWESGLLDEESLYYPMSYASVIDAGKEIPGPWLLVEHFDATRTQGSIFIYE